VPQVGSENLFGKSFAKTTAKAINGDFHKGNELTAKEKYTTEHNMEYSKKNFRQL